MSPAKADVQTHLEDQDEVSDPAQTEAAPVLVPETQEGDEDRKTSNENCVKEIASQTMTTPSLVRPLDKFQYVCCLIDVTKVLIAENAVRALRPESSTLAGYIEEFKNGFYGKKSN